MSLLTRSILPLRTSTVARSIGGPLIGRTRALRIARPRALVAGACAELGPESAASAAATERERIMAGSEQGPVGVATVDDATVDHRHPHVAARVEGVAAPRDEV